MSTCIQSRTYIWGQVDGFRKLRQLWKDGFFPHVRTERMDYISPSQIYQHLNIRYIF